MSMNALTIRNERTYIINPTVLSRVIPIYAELYGKNNVYLDSNKTLPIFRKPIITVSNIIDSKGLSHMITTLPA
jgi:hypothetical protein